jgi:hypothetical protein
MPKSPKYSLPVLASMIANSRDGNVEELALHSTTV